MSDRRTPERIRHTLSVESGFYDGLALAVLLLALAMASVQTDHLAGRWVGFVVRTEGLSTLAGAGIGALGAAVVQVRERNWMTDTWAQLATPALALACYQAGEHLHGSGFVAAFAGGLATALLVLRSGEIQQTALITEVAVVVVIVSLLVHGLTLPAGLRLYPASSADVEPKVL